MSSAKASKLIILVLIYIYIYIIFAGRRENYAVNLLRCVNRIYAGKIRIISRVNKVQAFFYVGIAERFEHNIIPI